METMTWIGLLLYIYAVAFTAFFIVHRFFPKSPDTDSIRPEEQFDQRYPIPVGQVTIEARRRRTFLTIGGLCLSTVTCCAPLYLISSKAQDPSEAHLMALVTFFGIPFLGLCLIAWGLGMTKP